MSANCRPNDYESVWRALYRQSDAFTANPAWPRLPGCETWAYDAADRTVKLVYSDPALLHAGPEHRRDAALRIHSRLAWQTARGRAARFRNRAVPIDDADLCPAARHHDSYGPLAVTAADVARAFIASGAQPVRAWAATLRIVHGLSWNEVSSHIGRTCGTAIPPAVMRVQFGRDLRRYGSSVLQILGLADQAEELLSAPLGA